MLKKLQILTNKPLLTTAIFLMASCGDFEIDQSSTNAYLGKVYDLSFTSSKDKNVLANSARQLDLGNGCKFDSGTDFRAVNLFKSSANMDHLFVLLYGKIKACPLKYGLVKKSSLEAFDDSRILKYMMVPKNQTEQLSVKFLPEAGSKEKCLIGAERALLSQSAPKVIGDYLYVNLISTSRECLGGPGYVELSKIDVTNLPSELLTEIKDEAVGPSPREPGPSTPVVPKPTNKNGLSKKMNAFLDTIAYAEGTGSSYNVTFTYGSFSSYADHPRRIYCSGSLCSDASGRYQFLSTTWDGVARSLGLKDFSPINQDIAAAELVRRRGAAGKVESIGTYKDFQDAIYGCALEWASLPGSPYGQPTKSAAVLWNVYQDALKNY